MQQLESGEQLINQLQAITIDIDQTSAPYIDKVLFFSIK